MTELPKRVFIRIPKGAAEPTQTGGPPLRDRLEEWLVLWGDWVRAYQGKLSDNLASSSFLKDIPSARQWQTTLEVIEDMRLESRTLAELDACVSSLTKAHYLILHWQYARAYRRRRVPALLRNDQLPPDGSPEYEGQLDAARDALAAIVVKRRVLIPE